MNDLSSAHAKQNYATQNWIDVSILFFLLNIRMLEEVNPLMRHNIIKTQVKNLK